MAEFIVFTEEQKKEFSAWVYDRPPIIQEMAAKYPPNRLYRLKSGSGKLRVIIRSYEENETVTVSVTGEYNLCTFERNVFGIPLSDLEECELPTKEDMTGAILTNEEDIDAFIDATRQDVLNRREANGQ